MENRVVVQMILFCPICYAQHIDKPDPERGWENPPHTSHLCESCGFVWRPADIPTEGVASIDTKGQKDILPHEYDIARRTYLLMQLSRHQSTIVLPSPAKIEQLASDLDVMIGRMDRVLSEFLIHCKRNDTDEADRQTLKHHADDLIGVGQKGLEVLRFSDPVSQTLTADRRDELLKASSVVRDEKKE